ncbi:MAG TPA: TetR/AcrR family transcriptional regulator [Acidimicrobiales bacterium]|nr:TetR/AcrR family transcriptional regulator [Acidimicrobiales bacterium]
MSTVAPDASEDAAVGERWPRTVAARSARAHGRRTLIDLLDAAVAELTAYGYHGARMNRIAKRAGTAHGTLYLYFTDKADLLAAIYDDVNAELEPTLLAMPALSGDSGGYEALRSWMADVCDAFQRNGAALQALTDAMSEDDSDGAAGTAAMRSLARTSAHIAERIREAGASDLDPNIAAICIWALIEGSNRSVYRGELMLSRDDLVTGLTEFVRRSSSP